MALQRYDWQALGMKEKPRGKYVLAADVDAMMAGAREKLPALLRDIILEDYSPREELCKRVADDLLSAIGFKEGA